MYAGASSTERSVVSPPMRKERPTSNFRYHQQRERLWHLDLAPACFCGAQDHFVGADAPCCLPYSFVHFDVPLVTRVYSLHWLRIGKRALCPVNAQYTVNTHVRYLPISCSQTSMPGSTSAALFMGNDIGLPQIISWGDTCCFISRIPHVHE